MEGKLIHKKKLRKNMDYVIKYHKNARKDLRRLPVDIAKRVVSKMRQYISLERPLSRAKKLKGDLSDCYRFRVGDYRVILKVQEDGTIVILLILKIAYRKESY